jgi:hypothetical protein
VTTLQVGRCIVAEDLLGVADKLDKMNEYTPSA